MSQMVTVVVSPEFEKAEDLTSVFPLPPQAICHVNGFWIEFRCRCGTQNKGIFDPSGGYTVCRGCGLSWSVRLRREGGHDGKSEERRQEG